MEILAVRGSDGLDVLLQQSLVGAPSRCSGELGPTPRIDLAAGQSMPVELGASGQTFTSWSVYVELGSGSA